MKLSDPRLDELIHSTELDIPKRKKLIDQLQDRLMPYRPVLAN